MKDRKLIITFYTSIPVVIIALFLVRAYLEDGNVWKDIFLGISSSLIGAYIFFVIERFYLGNPFDELHSRIKSFADILHVGLLRFFENRSIAAKNNVYQNVLSMANNLKVYGIVCNFLVHDTELKKLLSRKIPIEFYLLSPKSTLFQLRSEGENWGDSLKSRSQDTLKQLLEIKEKSKDFKIFVYDDECHEMVVLSDKYIIINPYVLHQRGPDDPVLLFSKANENIVKSFEGQLDKIRNKTEILSEEDIFELFN